MTDNQNLGHHTTPGFPILDAATLPAEAEQ